jgi:hypothetical protein
MRKLAKGVGAVFAAAAFAVALAPAAGAATTNGATSTVGHAATGFVWCGDHWERSRANGNDCGTSSGAGQHPAPIDPGNGAGHPGHGHPCHGDHDGNHRGDPDHWHHW